MKKLLWGLVALGAVAVAVVFVAGRREAPKQDDGTREYRITLRMKGDCKMGDGWVKQSGDAVGATYAGTLAVTNLDDMHLGRPVSDASQGVQVVASSAGGSAAIAWVKSARLQDGAPWDWSQTDWTADEQAAWDAWATGLPPTVWSAYGYLYAATASAGGATQTIYKVFGYYTQPLPPDDPGFPGEAAPVWHGDTEWVLPFSMAITNCVPYAKVEDIPR